MPTFSITQVKGGRPLRPEAFEAPDDAAAVERAAEALDGEAYDLWCGERLVARIAGDGGRWPRAATPRL